MNTSAYVKILRERLSNSIALPFRDILTINTMQQALNELNIKYRKRLRTTLLESGIKHGVHPLRLSFKGAIQHTLNFVPILAIINKDYRHFIYTTMLTIISHCNLPERPFRVEPRMVRKRTKVFPHLKRHRQEVRKKLVA